MIDVFVSRNEDDAVELIGELSLSNYSTICQSLISIEFLPFQIQKDFDWVFFSSSNGAHSFFKQTANAHAKYAAIGPATAKAVPFECDFVGEGTNTDKFTFVNNDDYGRPVEVGQYDRGLSSVSSNVKFKNYKENYRKTIFIGFIFGLLIYNSLLSKF
jgi:hypothetical protein